MGYTHFIARSFGCLLYSFFASIAFVLGSWVPARYGEFSVPKIVGDLRCKATKRIKLKNSRNGFLL